MSLILVLADLSADALQELSDCAQVVRVPSRRPTGSELRDVEVIVARSHVQIDADLLEAANALKLIVRPGSGMDNVDLDECRRRGIEVRRLGAEPSARSVAELALMATLLLLRRLGIASRGLARGEWLKHELLGAEILDRTVGIWGHGPVGQAVAELFDAVGAQIRVYTRTGCTGRFQPEPALEQLVGWAQVHIVAVPLSPDTRGLISGDLLGKMATRAPLIVNVSRWDVLDFDAAIAALTSGDISGLAIDPVDRQHVPRIQAAMEDPALNLLLSPHIGASTEESLRRMGDAVVNEVRRYLSAAREASRPL